MADSTVIDVSKMKVVELRKELRSRGLLTTGDKTELVARLQSALDQDHDEHADINLDSDEIDSDSVLEDDDDKSQSEIVLDDSAVELALEDPPISKDVQTKLHKRKLSNVRTNEAKEEEKSDDVKEVPSKKIVLNRATPIITQVNTKSDTDELKSDSDTKIIDEKVKSESDTASKNRLELRAKRFGLPDKMTEAERREARKLRFGGGNGATTATPTPSNITGVTNKISTATLSENLDKMKKRAERFGQSVSKIMTDIENREKLEKRKAKFGVAN